MATNAIHELRKEFVYNSMGDITGFTERGWELWTKYLEGRGGDDET